MDILSCVGFLHIGFNVSDDNTNDHRETITAHVFILGHFQQQILGDLAKINKVYYTVFII